MTDIDKLEERMDEIDGGSESEDERIEIMIRDMDPNGNMYGEDRITFDGNWNKLDEEHIDGPADPGITDGEACSEPSDPNSE